MLYLHSKGLQGITLALAVDWYKMENTTNPFVD